MAREMAIDANFPNDVLDAMQIVDNRVFVSFMESWRDVSTTRSEIVNPTLD